MPSRDDSKVVCTIYDEDRDFFSSLNGAKADKKLSIIKRKKSSQPVIGRIDESSGDLVFTLNETTSNQNLNATCTTISEWDQLEEIGSYVEETQIFKAEKDENKEICEYYNSKDGCFRGDYCDKKHVLLDKDTNEVIFNSEIFVHQGQKFFKKRLDYLNNEEMKMSFAWISSPDKFYFYRVFHTSVTFLI